MITKDIPWDDAPDGYDYWIVDDEGLSRSTFHKLLTNEEGKCIYEDVDGYYWNADYKKITVSKRPETQPEFDEKNPPINTPIVFIPPGAEFWRVGEVRYIGSHCVVIWDTGTREENSYEFGSVLFAPMKSEKEEVIKQMMSEVILREGPQLSTSSVKQAITAIYEAGYRKIKGEEE